MTETFLLSITHTFDEINLLLVSKHLISYIFIAAAVAAVAITVVVVAAINHPANPLICPVIKKFVVIN